MKQSQMIAALGALVWASSTFATPVAVQPAIVQEAYWSHNDVRPNDLTSSSDGDIISSMDTARTDSLSDFGIYSDISGKSDDFFSDAPEKQFNIVNVSEPGAWALLVLGVVGLILARRKTRE